MEIIKIVFMFTTLAVATAVIHESYEPTFLEPSPNEKSIHRAPTDLSDNLELLDQSVGGGDDHDNEPRVVADDAPAAATFTAYANESPAVPVTLGEEKPLYRQYVPQNLVQLLQNPEYYQENLNDEDCICHRHSGGVPMSQHINPEGNDLQRVVVYIYNKKGDPRVHLYIPDVQKQHYIPDLPLDEHDLLQPLDSDLLRLLVDSPFSVTKKVFKTRPDYNVERAVRPDVEGFRRLLEQLLLSRPKPYETLIRLIQKKMPKSLRKTFLTFLHSQYPDFEPMVVSPRVQVFPYDYDAEVQRSFEEHTVQPSLEFLLHKEPAYEEHQIVEPSYEEHSNVKTVPSPESSFLPGQEHPHFLPSFDESRPSDFLVPDIPSDFQKESSGIGIEVFPPYHEQRPPSETYDDNLVVPLTSGPERLLAYTPQPEPQVPSIEYSELASTVDYPSTHVTETPYEKPEISVHPTGTSPTENQEKIYPTNTPSLPSEDQHPVLPTRPMLAYEAFDPVSYRPTFDRYTPNSHEKTPADAMPYPDRPGQLPDLKQEDEYDDFVKVLPTRPLQYEAEFPVELYPRPTTYPTFDKLSPTPEEQPSDTRPYPTTPARLPTPVTPNPYPIEDGILYPNQIEDGIHPYQSKPAKNEEGYPVDERISEPENREDPHPSKIEYPWYEPEGDKSFTFPSYDDAKHSSSEPHVLHVDYEKNLYELPLELSRKPFGSVLWEQGSPQYEVKTQYTHRPDLVLTQELKKVPDQPQRLDLIIKYLTQLKSQPNYVINHNIVQQPGQIDLTLLQRLLNPEYSYESNGSQQPKAPEHFRDPTFEKWFEGQVVDLGNKFGEVNVDSLKVLIEGILRDHNLMFTKEGVLINKYGNTLNVGELKLRPIMIGNSVNVGIKTLLEEAINKKIKISSDSPYLHGLLVSLGTPPHVLGLVPLGYKSPPGKLEISGKIVNKPVTDIKPSPMGSKIQGIELPQDDGFVPWTRPGQSKVFSWTSPIKTIRYRPQVIRKTFKNIPLDKAGFRNFLANLKLSGLGNGKITVNVRPGESGTFLTHLDDLKSRFRGSDLPEFGNGKVLAQQRHSNSYLPEFNEDVVHPTGTPDDYLVHPTGTPTDPENLELTNWLSHELPQFRASESESLSVNAGLPSPIANGNLGLNADLDPRFRGIDLRYLRGILSALPNIVPPEVQVGSNDAEQLSNVADLVLGRSANLGVPGAKVNVDLGAGLQGSLDGLLSSRAHGSVDLGSNVKVPTGVAKDFEFTEYPVEPAHAAAGAPEFRIIGGNAATGSGPPLSNKGKSGPVVL